MITDVVRQFLAAFPEELLLVAFVVVCALLFVGWSTAKWRR